MNLNEQLQRAYNAGRRQGLNEQGIGPRPFVGPPEPIDVGPFPDFVGPIDPSQGIYGDDSYEPPLDEIIIGYDERGRVITGDAPPGIPLYDENGNPIGKS